MKHLLTVTLMIICTFGLCQSQVEEELSKPVVPEDDLSQEARIFYGYVAQPRQFPHMCSLLNRKSTGTYTLCGGALISQRHIITAAHCVNNVVSTTAGCGTVDRSRPYLNIQSSKFTPHPQYDPDTLNNDIAIWTLPIAVTFDSNVKAIRLPTMAQASATFVGATATVSGFGRYSSSVSSSSQILRYVNVRIVPNADCATIYGSHVVVSSTICALGYEFVEQGTCSGDSGSPMFIQEGTEKTQIAVTSFVSSKGCGSDRPTGYVRTASYLFWINQVTGVPIRY